MQEQPGFGVTVTASGARLCAGNAKLMAREGISVPAGSEGDIGTVVHVAKEVRYLDRAMIADQPKETSEETISALRSRGIRTEMLTGDRQEVGHATEEVLGLDEVHTQFFPAGKVSLVENLTHHTSSKEVLD